MEQQLGRIPSQLVKNKNLFITNQRKYFLNIPEVYNTTSEATVQVTVGLLSLHIEIEQEVNFVDVARFNKSSQGIYFRPEGYERPKFNSISPV
ncbi:hypothetical protein AVEN_115350-1 [Araneus ventricosus]|uniref:Uncharacterized protein n=1 Tax=Araneus ventricosus TaxID=182803 RepID=A0A4Y1ZY77_ARAVE|nr:hypothetical protein AVEN_115350-1 [Araneus ventricosus]